MLDIVRRRFMLLAGALALAPSLETVGASAAPAEPDQPLKAPFAVPALTYAYEANEPSIDAQTMHLHHDKHHAAYVNNLNAAVKDHPEVAAMPLHEILAGLDKLPADIRTAVRNNAGGHANHTMFWQVMGGKGGDPIGEVKAAIDRDFGSFDKLKTEFNKAGTKVFGSGWAFVLVDPAGKLTLVSQSNQDSPLMTGKRVLFGNDVWEHAYYLKYQNRRPEYLDAWWKIVNWQKIDARYAAAKAGTLLV